MEGLIDWNRLAEFFLGHVFELIIGAGTTATAIGTMRVRQMLVKQISVQTIVFSEAAAQQLAGRAQPLDLTELRERVIVTYREILRTLLLLTAPKITEIIGAQLIVKIKVLSLQMNQAADSGALSKAALDLYGNIENLLIALINDLISAKRKAERHRNAINDINEKVILLLDLLGDRDAERQKNIRNSNILPGSNILFRFLFRAREHASFGIRF